MNLFENNKNNITKSSSPLSNRMRPVVFEEYIGQNHIMSEDSIFRISVEKDMVPSMIFWGPPGSGKTTLARLISQKTQSRFIQISAINSNVSELRKIIIESERQLGEYSIKTILFIDEIHRFSKSQQDSLLSAMEEGIITLIGATTENPSFTINNPILSRSRVFALKPLSKDNLLSIIERAIKDETKGLGKYKFSVNDNVKEYLINVSKGDARIVLDLLEFSVQKIISDNQKDLLISDINNAVKNTNIYDRNGDEHYDSISAFIKSIRGSDPNAAIYYLSKMIDSGEDPLFIARRLVISAAEDIGLANPNALAVAIAAQQSVTFIGMPEGKIPLAEATIFLASSEKSNSAYEAINKAEKIVSKNRHLKIPKHLRNAPTEFMKTQGNSLGYKYPHNYKNNFIEMEYLPKEISNEKFYSPNKEGIEKRIYERLNNLWKNKFE